MWDPVRARRLAEEPSAAAVAALLRGMLPVSDLLTLAEAADLLHVSVRTMQRLVAERQVRVVMVRSKRRVTAAELERFVKTRERLA